ncbi:hypothetical protein [Caulobacter sp. NIBR1757]|uniref:hypothetical protein n=1 Tax=Caulobacter sp. NIBR1757 TaxID=3016000 RepID=UPI0022F07DB0|nr:hypothetical protein [Caulobacter sp. NIBR1757]WGM40441.1 hypothetical protein AMEJIAPC_03386 [Caulobacter sp. NIBR1757]
MSGPWSKLKSRVEDLWVPKLGLAIHATRYKAQHHNGAPEGHSRHWIRLNKTIIWDFPGQFLPDRPSRGAPLYGVNIANPNGGYRIGNLLRDYLDRDRDRLFEPFENDGWELTDILRAADRRVGRERLLAWAETTDEAHPALAVLRARFGLEAAP